VEKDKIVKGPKVIHPEKPSAIGSRNSMNRDGRNEYQEASLVIDEEVDKILNHITSKLPPEVLDKLDVMGSVKDKLHNYYNQNLQNMQNRYLVTVEDEFLKKYRDLVDREEFKQLNRYTALNITEIMDKIGGEDQFNTREIEKSIVNVYEHLQGHLQRGIQEFEHNTNALLRQKNEVGAFIRRDNAYAIVKCSLKNNSLKPKTVFDVKLAINILDSELLTPIYHYQKPLQQLLKEIISGHIHQLVEKNIEEINSDRINSGAEELKSDEKFMEKLKALENQLSFGDDPNDENSKRYDFIAKRFLDSLESEDFEIPADDETLQNIRENIKEIIDRENIKNQGFNRIINALTTILDNSKMGYQFIDNLKNARVCIIREYALKGKEELPDETFVLRLSYFDSDQLTELRNAYDIQFGELTREIEKASDVVEKIFTEFKKENDISSFKEIAADVLQSGKTRTKKWWEFWKEAEVEEEDDDLLWDELSFMQAKMDVDDSGPATTNINKTNLLKHKINFMKSKVLTVYGTQYPEERLIVEDRIKFLEEKFQEFAALINPHHIQQGLVLEVDITSVKRRRTTMHAMSDVLNEFLAQVSKGFSDQSSDIAPTTITNGKEEINRRFTSVLKDMDKSLEEVEA